MNHRAKRRKELLTARAACVERMSEQGRRAFEQRLFLDPGESPAPAAVANSSENEEGHGDVLPRELRNLINEAHRLRRLAERRKDVRAAMKGLDMAMKALQLYGQATGQVHHQGTGHVTVNVVGTREDGIEIAAELLLELATAAEVAQVIRRLEERLRELADPVQGVAKFALGAGEPPLCTDRSEDQGLDGEAVGDLDQQGNSND